MKAIILVGGYGTRLRPLTFSKPKPLVPFINKPIVVHQIEALVGAGVKEIILAVNYQPQVMLDFLRECEKTYGVKIVCSQEDEPLGTAGPLALARAKLQGDAPFFMFNSDVICEFPLSEMLAFHKAHGGEGTIMVTPVKDPSKYGVVVSDEAGKIERFVEKPQEWVGDHINAGIYLFNPAILERIELRPTSIEREIFPVMAEQGQLYAMRLPGYWMDIGQPKDYLRGLVLHLDALAGRQSDELTESEATNGSVVIHPSAVIEDGALIGPHVVIGPDVVVGAGARIQRSAVFGGARIGKHAVVKNTIVGWETHIGDWAHVDRCVLGEDVKVGKELVVLTTTVCPHKGVKANQTDADKIIL